MNDSNIDTRESAWIACRNRVEYNGDIISRSPRFSLIERFLVHGGGEPFDMYCRIMAIIFPKDSKAVTNIMNELSNR